MKYWCPHSIFLSILIISATSCDVPQRNRYINSGPGITNISGDENTGDTPTNTFTSVPSEDDSQTDSTSNQEASEPGYENCNLGYSFYGGTLGYFGICQQSNNERGFKFKFQNQYTCQGGSNMSTNCGTCIIPMHMLSNGTSYKLGPAQCVHQNAGQTYYGTFSKVGTEAINAAIVIHRYSLDSFTQCMNAKSNYLSQCYGGAYNQQCLQGAESYATQVCTSFTQQHSNYYKQVSF